LKKVELTLREEEMAEANDPKKVVHFLNVLLATKPELLHAAQKSTLAHHAMLIETDEPIPAEIQSADPLPMSSLNAYGVIPADLNTWERAFAEFLDRDRNQIVKWWHRNLPLKPWSVNVLLPDGKGFYPDFVVGINGRKTEHNALLADPKFHYQTDDGIAKIQAEHRSYGRVMILDLEGGIRWWTVGYDEKAKKAIKAREFRLADAAGF
jgi:type III restriction enzyme